MLITTKTIVSFKMPEEEEQRRRFCETDACQAEWAFTDTTEFATYTKSATYEVKDCGARMDGGK